MIYEHLQHRHLASTPSPINSTQLQEMKPPHPNSQKSLPFPLTSSVQHRSRILQQIRLSQIILRIPRIILQNTLDRIIRLHINRQRLGADDPRNALAARRGGERARVLVDAVRMKVVDQPREVEGAGLREGSGLGYGVEVGEDGVEERGGVAERGELEEECYDGDGAACG
jgi:hypothetical protein